MNGGSGVRDPGEQTTRPVTAHRHWPSLLVSRTPDPGPRTPSALHIEHFGLTMLILETDAGVLSPAMGVASVVSVTW
jgi:hypothetical protein